MASDKNPFGKSGAIHQVKIKYHMENIYDRHGKGIYYHATLSFDPVVFEPGQGSKLVAQAFALVPVGFDEDDLEQLEAMGVSVSRWEASALGKLAGFGAMDAWLEESATDEQSIWLEESGYMDDVIDMEPEFKERFKLASLKPVHA